MRNSENRSPKIGLFDSDLPDISWDDVFFGAVTFSDEIAATSLVKTSMQSIDGTDALSWLGSTITKISLASFL